jgi:hypothetical protein
MLLEPAYRGRHSEAYYGFRDQPDAVLVMWSEGAVHWPGSVPGEHDGIRDGYSSGRTDWSANQVLYATLEDWVAAGNPAPGA